MGELRELGSYGWKAARSEFHHLALDAAHARFIEASTRQGATQIRSLRGLKPLAPMRIPNLHAILALAGFSTTRRGATFGL